MMYWFDDFWFVQLAEGLAPAGLFLTLFALALYTDEQFQRQVASAT
jgi:hypothetical protein